jgi:hypothetical protein
MVYGINYRPFFLYMDFFLKKLLLMRHHLNVLVDAILLILT